MVESHGVTHPHPTGTIGRTHLGLEPSSFIPAVLDEEYLLAMHSVTDELLPRMGALGRQASAIQHLQSTLIAFNTNHDEFLLLMFYQAKE